MVHARDRPRALSVPGPLRLRADIIAAPLSLVGEGKGEGDASSAGLFADVPTGLGKTAMAVLGWL